MFERFTQDARRTVVLAQELARRLGHTSIGTQHLLLALLDDPEGVPVQALAAVGLRVDGVRSEIERAVPPTEAEVGKHVPFTPRAKKVLELSLRESMRLRQRTIEPGHVLLGLIREGQGVAAEALVKQGADLAQLGEEVARRLVGPDLDRAGMRALTPDPPQMTRGGVAAFDRARQLAKGGPVATQHVLLGLFGDEDTLAKRALTALGVTREAVERELARLDPAGTADEPPDRAGARHTRLQVSGDVVTLRFEDKELAGRLGATLRRWGRRGQGGEVDLSGAEPAVAEPFARLWRAADAVSRELVFGLTPTGGPPTRGGWKPPGWTTRATVAGYSVTSEPEGFRSRLWTSEDVDEADLRAWLAGWLPRTGTGVSDAGEDVVYFTALVGRARDVEPDAPDPDEWVVANFSFGAGPAPVDWPRRPLAELLAYASTDLRRPAEPPDPAGRAGSEPAA